MLEALGTGCPDHGACWRPVDTPDGFPFASPELALVWAAVFVLLLVALRGLGRD